MLYTIEDYTINLNHVLYVRKYDENQFLIVFSDDRLLLFDLKYRSEFIKAWKGAIGDGGKAYNL